MGGDTGSKGNPGWRLWKMEMELFLVHLVILLPIFDAPVLIFRRVYFFFYIFKLLCYAGKLRVKKYHTCMRFVLVGSYLPLSLFFVLFVFCLFFFCALSLAVS